VGVLDLFPSQARPLWCWLRHLANLLNLPQSLIVCNGRLLHAADRVELLLGEFSRSRCLPARASRPIGAPGIAEAETGEDLQCILKSRPIIRLRKYAAAKLSP
jgi:hypothetical protein